MISKGCTYAIQMAMYLAQREGAYVPVRTISDELRIPRSFLAKVAGTLSRAGVLDAHRGPAGGVALAKRPEEVSVSEIIRAIDGGELFTECVLGLPGCGVDKPCPLHHLWGGIRDGIGTTFMQHSLSDLLAGHAADHHHSSIET